MYDSLGQCNLCREEYTSTHIEVKPGTILYVCNRCLEKAKENFVWVCINCGQAYFRPKELILSRLQDAGMEHAPLLCEGVQLIQGIDICIACDPEGIMDYVSAKNAGLDTSVFIS